MRSVAIAAVLLWAGLAAGCGAGLMQTARTTPQGTTEFKASAGYVYNFMVEERGNTPTNVPFQLGMRYGAGPRVDVGVSTFMGLGGLVDAKLNLIAGDSPLAVAVQGGLGLAGFPSDDDAAMVHVPVRAMISYDLDQRSVTPYAGLGLGMFWLFGYPTSEGDGEPVDRAGHGDGVLLCSAGVELGGRRSRSYFLEYSYWRPVLDDQGDGYAFARNHMFLVGTRW